MTRQQRILFAVLGLGVALVAFLAWSVRQPPVLPADRDHVGVGNTLRCLDCHGPAGEMPRGRNHPAGEDCARCHGLP